jgi:RNA polymerase sigma-70 factor (ECF subfamily)
MIRRLRWRSVSRSAGMPNGGGALSLYVGRQSGPASSGATREEVVRRDSSGAPQEQSRGTRRSDDDAQLVDRVLAACERGDDREAQGSFRVLFERYHQRVLTIAQEVLRSREDAEDVVQEAFVKAYLSLADFRRASSFYTWLYRIVFNMAVDVRRRIARRGGPPQEYDETAANGGGGLPPPARGYIESPHEAVLRAEQRRRINAVLNELSEEHRAVIVLREVEGLPYEEIAEVVGISKGTVMSRLFYARRRMQRALADLRPEGEGVVRLPDEQGDE